MDPWGLSVSPHHFDEHLAVLRQWGPVLPLAEMVRALRAGTLPPRATVLTFDDGYADNLHAALPLLERNGLPATFFLTTGTLGCAREFWWDELERVLLGPAMLPSALHLTLGREDYVWELAGDTAPVPTPRSWRAWEHPPTLRHALYYDLWQRLVEHPLAQQRETLNAVLDWAAASSKARPSHRTLTPAEALALARSPLAEVGAHTVTHPALPSLALPRQRAEIAESKTHLETLLDRSISAFSYPYGHNGPDTRHVVFDAGFACACTTEPDPVRPGADLLAIPRVQVMDSDGDAFAKQMVAWLRTT